MLPVPQPPRPSMGTADVFGLRAADLVFDPTLACCKVDVPAPAARGVTAREPYGALVARIPSSPPAPDNRELGGQGLLLSRTMLSNHKLPYVGRFACDWPRLATTDPHAARAILRRYPIEDRLARVPCPELRSRHPIA